MTDEVQILLQSLLIFSFGLLCGWLLHSLSQRSVFRRGSQGRGGSPELQLLSQLQQRVDSLARVFEMPRSRGQTGEWLLERLLADCMPPGSYKLQHEFRRGGRADALILLGNLCVAVDAKFPLESISGSAAKTRKAVLQHSASIAEKYIVPEEGSLNFAIMYIPSESLFQQLCTDTENGILQGCLQLGIIPAGPASLFLYLQTAAYGLRGMEFNRNFAKYAGKFAALQRSTELLKQNLDTAHTQLRNFSRNFDTALDEAGKIARDSKEVLNAE
ncbi:DNA recombination protein RmuC [Spirochaeta dissipatitropha]